MITQMRKSALEPDFFRADRLKPMTVAINRTSDAKFTPSKKELATGIFRIRGTIHLLNPINRNAGRKFPPWPLWLPQARLERYPNKIAVVNTGPGVTWPMAKASKI